MAKSNNCSYAPAESMSKTIRPHVYLTNPSVIEKYKSIPVRKRSEFIEKCVLYYMENSTAETNLTEARVEAMINAKIDEYRRHYSSEFISEINDLQDLVTKAKNQQDEKIKQITSSIYDL